MQVTVTPKYVDAPRPGKKNWSMKDEGGTSYSVPAKFAPLLQVGVPVLLTYEVSNYNGKNFNMVEAAAQVGAPQPERRQGTYSDIPVPGAKFTPPQAAPRVEPKANGHTTTDVTPERIFVCGVVNACIKREGLIDAHQLVNIIETARQAWAQTLGRQ